MSGCHECAWGKVAGCWRCGSARGMEVRSIETEGLDPKGDSPVPTGTRPETTAPQPVAPEGEAQARKLLREFIDLCEVGDVDENTEALGWGDLILEAKSYLATVTQDDLTKAVSELSQAMGSPAVRGRGPDGLLSATVRLAAQRLAAPPPSPQAAEPVATAEDKRDAERYRWLRGCSPIRSDRACIGVHWPLYENGVLVQDYRYLSAEKLDNAIDAALRGEAGRS